MKAALLRSIEAEVEPVRQELAAIEAEAAAGCMGAVPAPRGEALLSLVSIAQSVLDENVVDGTVTALRVDVLCEPRRGDASHAQ